MSASPSSPSDPVVIRCMCGRRYRIRDAKAGMRTRCPECDSLVEVTEADLETSFSADGLINLHEDQTEAREAILVSDDGLRLAAKGARPGVTGKTTHTSEDAMLAAALGGRSAASFNPEARGTVASGEPPPRQRAFVEDLLASFWCAGNKNNAINIVMTALPLAVLWIVTPWIPFPFNLLTIVPLFIIVIWIIQFYWFVLVATTRGEDEIPWFESDWNLWDDVARPFFWVMWISFLCSVPSMWANIYLPAGQTTSVLSWVLLAGGWFFWPVAVMSYAMGRSFTFLRPDWLIRCIVGIGPVYILAWVLVIGTLAAWYGFYAGMAVLESLPLVAQALLSFVVWPLAACLNIYFGYVLFRMIGLLFRHYRASFPWKF